MNTDAKIQQGTKLKNMGTFAHRRVAELARDGVAVYEAPERRRGDFTMNAAERRASADPHHAWRAWVRIKGRTRMFERAGQNNWRSIGGAS